jgi:anti-anti-sigma factor
MTTATVLFEIDWQGDTLFLIPRRDLRELEYQEIEEEEEGLFRLVDELPIRNVVVDFAKTDYFGSTALGLLAQLGRKARARGCCMALCNVSAHEQDILDVAGLAAFWPIYSSREKAVKALAA